MGIEKISIRQTEEHLKGWGRELWIANNEKYCGKILEFKVGAKFSSHFHFLKAETFFIFFGELELTTYDLSNADEITQIIKKGDVIDIPAGNPHQIKALTDATIIEISTQHFEDDSYRIKKGDSQK